MDDKIYDVIILGGGPAGLSAVIYARRAKLETLLIEKDVLGGEILKTPKIDNYPGGVKGESGSALIERMKEQAESFGGEFVSDEVMMALLDADTKSVLGKNGTYKGKTVVIATGHGPGNIPKPLGIKGEDRFVGTGVSYCATCDAPFFSGLDIVAICEDKDALDEAMYLADFARKLTIITSKNSLKGDDELLEKAESSDKIEILSSTNVLEIKGEETVSGIVTENSSTGEKSEINAKQEDGMMGVFIFAGNFPQTKMFEGVIDMDDGYIITDENMCTNVDGVFAAGDVRKKDLRQIVTAAADGAIAAIEAKKYIK